jgi:L-threonylcarbamoyladenylate synthase
VLSAADAEAFERTIVEGGVAVFPTDTLYGLGCLAGDESAIERLHELKGRRRDKPSALMCFSIEAASEALESLGARTRAAVERLLPGAVLVVLPGGTGLRVPSLAGPLAALASVKAIVLQTSANLAGGPEPVSLADVPHEIRDGADLVLDGGTLSGVPSTVVDLARYEQAGEWVVLRDGAVDRHTLEDRL